MCGRFSLFPYEDLPTRYDATMDFDIEPRYNIAPSQDSPVVFNGDNGRQIAMMSWGILSGERNVINIRQETLEQKKSFQDLMSGRRCLIPVTAFYEWKSTKVGKVPYLFYQRQMVTFSLAGLWNRNAIGSQNEFAVLTTKAQGEVSRVHNRMPLIIPIESEALWLDGSENKALNFLRTLPRTELRSHQVSPIVNDPKNEGQKLIEPISRIENWAERP